MNANELRQLRADVLAAQVLLTGQFDGVLKEIDDKSAALDEKIQIANTIEAANALMQKAQGIMDQCNSDCENQRESISNMKNDLVALQNGINQQQADIQRREEALASDKNSLEQARRSFADDCSNSLADIQKQRDDLNAFQLVLHQRELDLNSKLDKMNQAASLVGSINS